MSSKDPKVGINIEERTEERYDLLHLTVPVPHLALLPEETRQHLTAAWREQLLAFRSLVDVAIKQTEKSEEPKHSEHPGPA